MNGTYKLLPYGISDYIQIVQESKYIVDKTNYLERMERAGNFLFLTGLKYNSQGIPVIVSNGIGTSRRDVRLFTPSEVVVLRLVRKR